MNKKLEVGQVLYGVMEKNYNPSKKDFEAFTVTKVGRQYFYASTNPAIPHFTKRFSKDNWIQHEDSNYGYGDWKLYESEEEYNKVLKLRDINKKLADLFRSYNLIKKLETAEKILKLIEEDRK